jgi:hypothetical protein
MPGRILRAAPAATLRASRWVFVCGVRGWEETILSAGRPTPTSCLLPWHTPQGPRKRTAREMELVQVRVLSRSVTISVLGRAHTGVAVWLCCVAIAAILLGMYASQGLVRQALGRKKVPKKPRLFFAREKVRTLAFSPCNMRVQALAWHRVCV